MSEPSSHHPILKPTLEHHATNYWCGLHGCAGALAISELFQQQARPILIIADNSRKAEQMTAELQFFCPKPELVTLFPDWECLPYDQFSPHEEIISSRLAILAELTQKRPNILVITLANLMQKLPPVEYINGFSFQIKVGDKLDIENFRQRLTNAAYLAVSQVVAPGEFAVRGGLIDIFPMGSTAPLRIDLFDNEIESLKYFDPETQRTTETTLAIELLPAREFPFNDQSIALFRENFRKTFATDPKQQSVYNDVSNHHISPGLEFFFPLFFHSTATFFDYLAEDTLVFKSSDLAEQAELNFADIQDRYENANLDPSRKVLPPHEIYLAPNFLHQQLNQFQAVAMSYQSKNTSGLNFNTQAPQSFNVEPKSSEPYQRLIQHLKRNQDRQILLAAETPGRLETLKTVLEQSKLPVEQLATWATFLQRKPRLGITVAPIERGLVSSEADLQIICETQLYGERSIERSNKKSKTNPESIIRSLAELKIGDPVVHENQGIGRYKGLQTIELDGMTNEFMVIEYQDEAKLYVPVLSLHLISRYSTSSPETAPLHTLGSDQWEKIKQKAKEKAYDVAVELLEVQALRDAREGHAFTIPQTELDLFAASFDHQETPDQNRAISEIIEDMGAAKPMDRLICGDVGFGKTEVAVRAAFIAVNNSKQVAMLVPTTLLAQQHFDTFQNRFVGQAVNIQLLSRFKTAKQIKQILAQVESGAVDIIIGTHRLLQSDINFKNLGLLILDEEQRFGVRQKERLKKLRHEVDILTLTATPIPRTLNQTMASMREISIISTPPKDRLSVQTFVRERNKGLIKEAIQREIRRGGQVYFLHNDVQTIPQQVEELQKLVPEIKVGIGHGQMPENQLETVMQNFYHRRFNVFVCTTIVESGIDNPQANTIIINKADRFGLAQLHQLRGRVGRSHHQAFAYLLVDNLKSITADAQKRLNAIASLKELGAGFALASHDLEIRGAGELLGEAQSGAIDQVGFSLYSQYLNQAIKYVNRSDDNASLDTDLNNSEIDIEAPALLPESFIPDVHMRLIFYKRIANANNSDELNELKIEMADRFGFLPDATKLLLELASLKPKAQSLGLVRVQLGARGGYFEFSDKPNFDPIKLINLIQQQHQKFQLQGSGRLNIKCDLAEPRERIEAINAVLKRLSD